MGFDIEDERAFGRLAQRGLWGKDGNDLQLVLLGVGRPVEFGGLNAKAGLSQILHTSNHWISRTPFVLTRHLARKGIPGRDAIAADPQLRESLIELVRFELRQREQFQNLADETQIEPILDLEQSGTWLGGHFTSWLKFRRERLTGGGHRAGPNGFGIRLKISEHVTGPIALGYGCHFGLGQFIPAAS
jgi:CRISPR-associated protein Csb2